MSRTPPIAATLSTIWCMVAELKPSIGIPNTCIAAAGATASPFDRTAPPIRGSIRLRPLVSLGCAGAAASRGVSTDAEPVQVSRGCGYCLLGSGVLPAGQGVAELLDTAGSEAAHSDALVPEMAPAGEHHRDPLLVGCGDDVR